MQKVINCFKVLIAAIMGVALIFTIAAMSACSDDESELTSGEYIVDVSWTGGMNNYMTLVVNINAEDNTFNQYYTSSSTVSKGSGSISYSKGVYTMTYSDISVDGVNTTTFTFDSETSEITFTSALLWGSSSFDTSTTTSDGSFATYKAQPIVASGEYNVDLEWTGGMAAYVTAIVNIDMSSMSFNLYYQSSPDTSKGTGSVIYADGVYTMTYSEAVGEATTTTFTYDYTANTITFTSALLWGSSSFDSSTTTEDGSFATYTAAYITSAE
ncbi:MAG: hypothetical protein LUF82_04830 [Clostridia bacterium]|nr:hypothetical protein [Clostridia bacterium]